MMILFLLGSMIFGFHYRHLEAVKNKFYLHRKFYYKPKNNHWIKVVLMDLFRNAKIEHDGFFNGLNLNLTEYSMSVNIEGGYGDDGMYYVTVGPFTPRNRDTIASRVVDLLSWEFDKKEWQKTHWEA
jgi:hypothetical protein